MWKVEFCRKGEVEHLAEDMPKQSVEGTARFLLAAFRKMWKKRDKLREEVFNQNELGLPSGKHFATFHDKKGQPRSWSQKLSRITPRSWNLMEFVQQDFKISWDQWLPSFLSPFFSFLNQSLRNFHPTPILPLFWEQMSCFSSFTGPRINSNCGLTYT